ncbi:hypothetical protein MAR_023086 [Mya arenaria]|uniref:Ribosomal protein S10 n=1 Tax=Mya arenaria TaxID=6604 RepID=A0ABY7DRI9_MYAAR|nr:hypothetical protein MAR_023086 [Mya arenaria]
MKPDFHPRIRSTYFRLQHQKNVRRIYSGCKQGGYMQTSTYLAFWVRGTDMNRNIHFSVKHLSLGVSVFHLHPGWPPFVSPFSTVDLNISRRHIPKKEKIKFKYKQFLEKIPVPDVDKLLTTRFTFSLPRQKRSFMTKVKVALLKCPFSARNKTIAVSCYEIPEFYLTNIHLTN